MDIYQRLKTRQHGEHQLTQQKLDDLYRWIREQAPMGDVLDPPPVPEFKPILDPTKVGQKFMGLDYADVELRVAAHAASAPEAEVCPSCGADSSNFDLDDYACNTPEGFLLDMRCDVCGATWTALYRLDHVEPMSVEHGSEDK